MNIVLLGAPGAGKGSVSQLLIEKKKYYHLSTGDALRAITKKDTPLAKEVNQLLKDGKLVSDEIVNAILKETLNNLDLSKYQGIIFDGYPRTKNQALYLNDLIKLDKVLFIKIPNEVIEQRLRNRRICSKCGKIYNLVIKEFQPKNSTVCDECHANLIQRKDDKQEVIKDRLVAYYKEIDPLIQYYKSKNLLIELDGTLPINE
ncbi:nucleoside monophosphate kinase [bacterium]|nr:nucleoside monophosphate kinase [bacterium]